MEDLKPRHPILAAWGTRFAARLLASVDAQPMRDSYLALSVTLNDPDDKRPVEASRRLINDVTTRATAAIARAAQAQSTMTQNDCNQVSDDRMGARNHIRQARPELEHFDA